MPTYIYEVVSEDSGAAPRRFEIVQRMSDTALTVDPESGLPVRRVITAGVSIKLKGLKRSTTVDKLSPASTRCGCGTGGHHHH